MPFGGLRSFRGLSPNLRMGSGSSRLPWDWVDNFTTPRAAGAINGSAAEPGPGNRVAVVAPDNLMTIGSDMLTVDGTPGTNETPRMYKSGAIARAAGICGAAKIRHRGDASGSLGVGRVGFHAPTFAQSLVVSSDRNTTWAPNPTPSNVGSASYTKRIGTNVWVEWLFRVRGAGADYLLNKGAGFERAFMQDAYTDASLNFGLRCQNGILHGLDIDWLKLADVHKWGDPAIISDSFNRADGAAGLTDGLGCEESGGSGFTWLDWYGSSGINSNRFKFASLTGGKAISVINAGMSCTMIRVYPYLVNGEMGILFMGKDALNYYLVKVTGTAVKITRVLNGVETDAATYEIAASDGTPLEVITNEVCANVFYGGSVLYDVRMTGGVATAPLDGTFVGLYSTSIDNTFDLFAVKPTFPVVPYEYMEFKIWDDFGDSLTDVFGSSARASVLQSHGIYYAHLDHGIGGETTVAMRRRFASQVLSKSPSVVCIQAGINNILYSGEANWETAANQVIGDLQTFCQQATDQGAIVVLVSLFPCKGHPGWNSYVQQAIEMVNAVILNPAGSIPATVRVDAYTRLGGADPAQLAAANDSGDRLHLSNPVGYLEVADEIYQQSLGVV